MKKLDEETKKKRKETILKVLVLVIILGISIGFSNVNLSQLGHDFFMKFLTFGLQQDEEQPAVTLEPDASQTPSEESSPKPEETETPSEEMTVGNHYVSVYFV